MNRLSIFVIVIALILTASSCAKKPPEQTAVKSKNILTVIRDLSKQYSEKDLSSFMADVASGYREREAFSRSLAAVFAKYETIRMNVQYTKMVILVDDKGQSKASFNWDGEWLSKEGTLVKDGGRATLVLQPGDFKLLSLDGKNPFIPQPGEIPGSKQ